MAKINDIPRDMSLIEKIRKVDTPHVETEDGYIVIEDPEDEFAPLFEGTWANSSVTQAPPAGFYYSKEGELKMRGAVTGGTVGTTVFTLPADFRPKFTMYFPADTDDPDVYSLDSVRFRAENN